MRRLYVPLAVMLPLIAHAQPKQYFTYPAATPLTGAEIVGPVRQNGRDVAVTTSNLMAGAAALVAPTIPGQVATGINALRNAPNGVAGTDAANTIGAQMAAPTDTGASPRSISAWKSDRINIRDFGAKGDTKDYYATQVVTAPGSKTLSGAAAGTFTAADIGKTIMVWGAGTPPNSGAVSSIAVATPGTGYTSLPSITISSPAGVGATAQPLMGMVTSSITFSGAGLPPNQTGLSFGLYLGAVVGTVTNVYFTASSDANGAIIPSSVVYQTPGVTQGQYQQVPPTFSTPVQCSSTACAGDTATPTATFAMGLAAVALTNGTGYPLTSGDVAAAISGGGSGSGFQSATLGAVTVSAPVAVLKSTITGLAASTTAGSPTIGTQDGSAVTMADAAGAIAPAPVGNNNYLVRWGTDDTLALQAAMAADNTRMKLGQAPCLYIPAGNYLISATPGQFAQSYAGCVIGDGPSQSVIYTTPDFSGTVFAWSDAWFNHQPGPVALNFGIHGPMWLSPYAAPFPAFPQQNGLMFLNHDDFAEVDHVVIQNLPGIAIGAGQPSGTAATGLLRESKFGVVTLWSDGAPGVPTLLLDSQPASGDETNEVVFSTLNIYGSNGPMIEIMNHSPGGGGVRDIHFEYLRLEGSEINPTGLMVGGDHLRIGDATDTGGIEAVFVGAGEMKSAAIGSDDIHLVCGANASAAPQDINIATNLGGGKTLGNGIAIDCAGGANTIQAPSFVLAGTAVSVGTASGVLGLQHIEVPSAGPARAIDPTVAAQVVSALPDQPTTLAGNPTAFGATLHSGSVAGGNPLGAGATDMQTTRTSASAVASGATATIGGGSGNTASASASTVAGGSANNNAGQASTIAGGERNTIASGAGDATIVGGSSNSLLRSRSTSLGGLANTDRGDTAVTYSSSDIATLGDSQLRVVHLLGTTTGGAAVRLATAPNSASGTNQYTIPGSGSSAAQIVVTAFDKTTPANRCSWAAPLVDMGRTAGNASTTLVTPVGAVTSGAGTGAGTGCTWSVIADQTHGQLNISVTPPSGSDTWDVSGVVIAAEAQ